MAVLPFAARAGTVDQAVPVWVGPVCHQALACVTVPVEQRGISTLHQVPGQRPDTTRGIESTLSMHDDAPAQPRAEVGTKSRHAATPKTRGAA